MKTTCLSLSLALLLIPPMALGRCKDALVEDVDKVKDAQAALQCWKSALDSAEAELRSLRTDKVDLQQRVSRLEERLRQSEAQALALSQTIESLKARSGGLQPPQQQDPNTNSAAQPPATAKVRRTELVMGPGDSRRVSDDLTVTAEPFDPGFGLALVVNGGRHLFLKPGSRINLSKHGDREACYLEVLAIPQEKVARGGKEIKVDHVCRPKE